jgi:RNA polymerase sigma factor (sigma-70 family)
MDEDFQLLNQYLRSRDEAAFRSLVERHAPLVRGVALRRTRDPELADEITNSVFVLLARKAGSVRGSLRGWLYNTSFLESGNALRKDRLYQRKMEELRRQPHHAGAEGGEVAWDEVSLRLDEAMSLLESSSRDLLLMRFYERKSLKEIARALGKSEEASRKLISRSLERLSGRLRNKGLLTSTTGLAALLSAQNLCVPAASASVIAAHAISVASLAGNSVFPPLMQMLADSPSARTAVLGFLLAAVPAGYYWKKSHALQEELAALRAASQPIAASVRVAAPPPAVMGMTGEPDSATASSAPAKKQETAEAFLKRTKDHGIKQAARELARININLPDLTLDQKDQIRALFEEQNLEKTARFAKALQSGALIRNATGPENLSDGDKAVLATLRRMDSDETDPVADILTEAQFAQYLQAKQARRISSAENTASDALQVLGQLFDLTGGQKDALFQALAQYELAAQKEWGIEIPFADNQREAGRQKIIRAQLSGEQTAIFENHVTEEQARRREFLQMMSDQSHAGDP